MKPLAEIISKKQPYPSINLIFYNYETYSRNNSQKVLLSDTQRLIAIVKDVHASG